MRRVRFGKASRGARRSNQNDGIDDLLDSNKSLQVSAGPQVTGWRSGAPRLAAASAPVAVAPGAARAARNGPDIKMRLIVDCTWRAQDGLFSCLHTLTRGKGPSRLQHALIKAAVEAWLCFLVVFNPALAGWNIDTELWCAWCCLGSVLHTQTPQAHRH